MLEEVVEAFGGWEAAVFLDSGVVNLDVDVAAWPVEDQVCSLCPVPINTFRNTLILVCGSDVDVMRPCFILAAKH